MTDFTHTIDQTHSIDHVDPSTGSTPDERPQFKTKTAREKQRKREATERSNVSRSRLKDQAVTFNMTLYSSQLFTPSEFEEIKVKTSKRRKALGQLRRWMQKHDFKDGDFRRMIYLTLKTNGHDVSEESDLSSTIIDAIMKMQGNEKLRMKLLNDADTVAKMRREKHILT